MLLHVASKRKPAKTSIKKGTQGSFHINRQSLFTVLVLGYIVCVSLRPNKHCNVFFKMFWNLLCLQQLTVSFFSSFSGTSLPFMTHNTFNSYLPLQSAEMCIPLSSWCAFCSCVVFSVHKTQTIQGLAPLVVKISTGSLFILDILCFVALSSSYVTTSNFNTAHLNSVKQKASDSY